LRSEQGRGVKDNSRWCAALLLAAATAPYCVTASAEQQTSPITAEKSQERKEPEKTFDVHEYRVLGNTVLATRDVERVLYPLLGDAKTLQDVEAARTALESAYHDHGYATVFVDIPPQEVADGVVRLRVTEGRVHERSISGAHYFSERQILTDLPATATGGVPNLAAVQQQLSVVNTQTADRSVVPIIKAGPEPGTVDLALKVDDHLPLHATIELNDQYTPQTSPLRANVGLSYTNLFGALDSLSAQYQFSPQTPNELAVFAINYAEHPLGDDGWRPSVYFIDSSSNVATVGTIGVLGKGQIAGTRLSYPVTASDADSMSFALGADYKHFRNTVNLAQSSALVTPISYVNLSIAFSGAWHSRWTSGNLNLSANFGPRGLTNSNAQAFENDRFEGRANYFYVRGDGAINQTLPAGFHLMLRAAGQYTEEPLIANEDYVIAGSDGVRGYLEAEELGDTAIKGTVQLQSPPLLRDKREIANSFVFYDVGRANMLQPLAGEPPHSILRSWGAGFNILPLPGLTGSLAIARPLVTASQTHTGETRVLFDLRGAF
jgi:hemolysin activation/secretion protein